MIILFWIPYWDLKLSKKLKSIYGDIDLIYSANTLTHISNLNIVFKSINNIDGYIYVVIPKIDLNLLTLSDKSLWGVENLKEIPSSTGSSTKKISKNKIKHFKIISFFFNFIFFGEI